MTTRAEALPTVAQRYYLEARGYLCRARTALGSAAGRHPTRQRVKRANDMLMAAHWLLEAERWRQCARDLARAARRGTP